MNGCQPNDDTRGSGACYEEFTAVLAALALPLAGTAAADGEAAEPAAAASWLNPSPSIAANEFSMPTGSSGRAPTGACGRPTTAARHAPARPQPARRPHPGH